ncbi:hypothetical protein [Kitasatospora sp. NPDC059599]|uniref:hypothetical protein n=1 Tax=Kitasatospora sp. NPDC059599 TaxID=3346880 RepID=UPI00367ACDC9
MAELHGAPDAAPERRTEEPRRRDDRGRGDRPGREDRARDERDRADRGHPERERDRPGRERDSDRADRDPKRPGGEEPGRPEDGPNRPDRDEPARPEHDRPEHDREEQERSEHERAAGRFRERSRDRLLDEQEEEGGAATGMAATSRAHRSARSSYQVGGDHTLFDRSVFHSAHIGDVHLRLDSRQAVGAASGPVPESELRRVRRIYREPDGYVGLQRALRHQHVLVLAAAPGTGRTCTTLALLDELTDVEPAEDDAAGTADTADTPPSDGGQEPPARVSRVAPDTPVSRLTAVVREQEHRHRGYLLELPSGGGRPVLPPEELELDALAAALAARDSFAVLVVAAGPTAAPLLSGRYGLICPPAPTEELLRARLAERLAEEADRAFEDDPGADHRETFGRGPGARTSARAEELADDPELRAAVGLEDLRPAEAELLADLIAAHVLGRLGRADLLDGCASLAPQQAQEWFAGADREIADTTDTSERSAATVLHPTASRIALAVLNGSAHSTVAEAAHLLTWELAIARDPANAPARPLFCDDPTSDLAFLRAELTTGEVETAGIGAPARIVRYRGAALPAAVLAEVWDRHHPAREPVVRWMRLLADDPRPEVWVRAALASGELCARDFATGYEKLVRPMATAPATQRRAFAATVLDQTARHESHRPTVRALVRDWAGSDSARLRWTAAMALGFGRIAPVEEALDRLARIGADEDEDQAPLASYSAVRLLSGPDDRAVLRRIAEWTADRRVPYQDLGLLTTVRLALTTVGEVWDGEDSPDLAELLDWPLPLAIAATRPDRSGALADLMWTALRTPRSHEAAVDCLEYWLRGAVPEEDGGPEDGPDTRRGLAALLPHLIAEDRERQLLDWLLRRMMNDPDDPLDKTAARRLWHLATSGRPAPDDRRGELVARPRPERGHRDDRRRDDRDRDDRRQDNLDRDRDRSRDDRRQDDRGRDNGRHNDSRPERNRSARDHRDHRHQDPEEDER